MNAIEPIADQAVLRLTTPSPEAGPLVCRNSAGQMALSEAEQALCRAPAFRAFFYDAALRQALGQEPSRLQLAFLLSPQEQADPGFLPIAAPCCASCAARCLPYRWAGSLQATTAAAFAKRRSSCGTVGSSRKTGCSTAACTPPGRWENRLWPAAAFTVSTPKAKGTRCTPFSSVHWLSPGNGSVSSGSLCQGFWQKNCSSSPGCPS